jgi:hypothetical protein
MRYRIQQYADIRTGISKLEYMGIQNRGQDTLYLEKNQTHTPAWKNTRGKIPPSFLYFNFGVFYYNFIILHFNE